MSISRLTWIGLALGLTLPLMLYTTGQWQRPRSPVVQQLFAGVNYERQINAAPWEQVIHIVTVDLTAPGVEVVVSPGQTSGDDGETTAQTTAQFLTQTESQVAVNANFFNPFVEKTPWNFQPRAGDRANVLGIGMADGQTYSPPEANWPALCFSENHRAQVVADGTCPNGTQQAIAGNQQLVAHGQAVPIDYRDRAYARVMAVVSRGGRQLAFVVIDGKQPYYSKGATLAQLTEIALSLDADAALNLDGGGSSTLVIETPNGTRPLNAPIHTKWPGRQRPVANHLGIRAQPLP